MDKCLLAAPGCLRHKHLAIEIFPNAPCDVIYVKYLIVGSDITHPQWHSFHYCV